MSLPATDNFNRADGSVGANWTEQNDFLNVVSNKAQPAGAFNGHYYWNADVFGNDHYSQIVASTVATYFGPAVRASGSGGVSNAYFLQWTAAGANNALVYKRVSGSYTNIGSRTGVSNGDVWRLEVSGTSLQVKINGSNDGAAISDSSLSSGSAGLYGNKTGSPLMDDWQGDNLGGTNTTLSPALGALALAGQAVSLAFAVTMTAGSMAFAGLAPTTTVNSGLTATPAAGSLSLAGLAPSLGLAYPLPDGALTFTGQTPTRRVDMYVTPAGAALVLAGQAPAAVTLGTVAPGIGALALNGLAPNLLLTLQATPAAAALALTGQAPLASIGVIRAPALGALALAGQAPALACGLGPAVGTLTLAGLAPSIASVISFAPAAAALACAGLAPTLSIINPNTVIAAGIRTLSVPTTHRSTRVPGTTRSRKTRDA